jgi:tight adherence protein C
MGGPLLSLLAFGGTTVAVVLVYVLYNRSRQQAHARVRELAAPAVEKPARSSGLGELALSSLPGMAGPLLPADERQRSQLQQRLIQAGLYHPRALLVFLGAKMLLLGVAVVTALLIGVLGVASPTRALTVGICLGALGLIVPGLWLDRQRARRLAVLRRGLPDALDMLVLCLEGGVSLTSSLQRVTSELRLVHPLLHAELVIVQREMLLGLSAGEALQKFGARADLEEVRSLASVLLQNERYGASISRALRIHADTLRQQRQQRAEELAQKAAVKVLFPTVLCIFPAIFIVVLGPAAFQLMAVLARMK